MSKAIKMQMLELTECKLDSGRACQRWWTAAGHRGQGWPPPQRLVPARSRLVYLDRAGPSAALHSACAVMRSRHWVEWGWESCEWTGGGGRCACGTSAASSPRTAPVSLFSLLPLPLPAARWVHCRLLWALKQGHRCTGLWVIGTKDPSPGWC